MRLAGVCGGDTLSRAGNAAAVLIAMGAAAAVYLALVLAMRVVSHDDLALMPKGEKIAKFLKI